MSILDDLGAIHARMLAIREERLHPADTPQTTRDIAFPIKPAKFEPPVTIWGWKRPEMGVMHLSAAEFSDAVRELIEWGYLEVQVIELPAPSDERAAVEAAFPGLDWPGPHRHVQVIPGPETKP